MRLHLFILLMVVAATSCRSIRPQFPSITPEDIKFDPLPVSEVKIPVTVDLANKIPEIDQQLNAAFPIQSPNFPNETEESCNLRYLFQVVKNTPINVGFSNDPRFFAHLTTQIGASAGVTYCATCVNFFGVRCVVPKIGASCGSPGEAPRRIALGLKSYLDLSTDYALTSQTNLSDFGFIDQCRVTFLNINISGIIQNYARGRLPVGRVDQLLSTISLRSNAENAWNALSNNIQVDNGLYLKIHPEGISKSMLTGTGQSIVVTMGLQARPELSTDATPPTVTPLPSLGQNTGQGGLNIYSDLKIDYPYLSTKLTEAFQDYEVGALGKKIIIKNVKAFGTQNREMIIRVDFKGDARGCVYILGKPSYDADGRIVKFTNLDYDLDTRNRLVNLAAWLLEPLVLPKIEEKAKFEIGSFIDANIGKLNGYLTKDHGNGLSTEGQVDKLEIVPNNFQSLPAYLFIRMHVTGQLSARVNL